MKEKNFKYAFNSIVVLIFLALFITGVVFFKNAMFSAEEPTEYQISKGLDKVNGFIGKCNDPYKITIANSKYQFSCDAGYIIVEPYVLEAFEKQNK